MSSATRDRIGKQLPAYGSAVNPVDTTVAVINSVETARECLLALFEDDNVDTVLLQITNLSGQRTLELTDIVCSIGAEYDRPFLICWTGGTDKDDALERYAASGILVFENPSRCIDTSAAIDEFRRSKAPLRAATDLPARLPDQLSTAANTTLEDREAAKLLEEYGLKVRPGDPDGVRTEETVSFELTLETVVDDHFGPLVRLARGGDVNKSSGITMYRMLPTVPERAAGMIADLDTGSIDELTDDQCEAIGEAVSSVPELYCDGQWIRVIDIDSLMVTDGGVIAAGVTITEAEDDE